MNEQDLIRDIEADERIRDAAHEMLAALKFLADKISDPALVAIADAAITKAEGRL